MIGLALARGYQLLLAHGALLFTVSLVQLTVGFFLYLGLGLFVALGSGVVIVGIVLCLVLMCIGVVSGSCVLDAAFRGADLPAWRTVIVRAFGPGVLLALPLVGSMAVIAGGAGMPGGLSSAGRVAAAVVLIWLFVVAFQGAFVFAACTVIHGGAGSAACRDALLLTFGNPLFSLGVPILLLLPGLLTLGLVPGPSGLLAVYTDSARLRLRRYAAQDPLRPDWSQLLSVEVAAQRKRSLGTLLFPWRNI